MEIRGDSLDLYHVGIIRNTSEPVSTNMAASLSIINEFKPFQLRDSPGKDLVDNTLLIRQMDWDPTVRPDYTFARTPDEQSKSLLYRGSSLYLAMELNTTE
jgi:hypothetical protein